MKPTTTKVTDSMIREGIEVVDCYFGVDWDHPTITVLNAILMDILSYRRLMKPGQRLVVVCRDAKFLSRSCKALGVTVEDKAAQRNKCEIWKLYYMEECPAPPTGSVIVYTKQVDNPDVKRISLTKNDERYPSLWNQQDNHLVPPGKSPNINKIPPRYTHSYPTSMY